jgi:hypothetical protein
VVQEWRKYVKDAIDGAVDWDSDALRGGYSLFESRWIGFEGQMTVQRGDIQLTLHRSSETAIALKTLKSGSRSLNDQLCAAEEVRKWVEVLRSQIRVHLQTSGPEPTEVAAHLLAIISLVRGRALSENELLQSLERILAKPAEIRPVAPDKWGINWKRLETVLSRSDEAIRAWFVKNVGASKGLSIEVPYLDTAPLLPVLRAAIEEVRLNFELPTEAQWPARSLTVLKETLVGVQQMLPKALEDVGKEVEAILARIAVECGKETPAKLGIALRTALDTGRTAAVFDDARLAEVRPLLDDLAEGKLDALIRTAHELSGKNPRNRQIFLCATVDLELLQRLDRTLLVVRQSFISAVNNLRSRAKQQGGADVPALESALRENLKSLRTDLEKIVEE